MNRLYFAITFASAMLAQAQGPGGPGHGGPEGFRMLGFDGGKPGQVVKGAPFSGSEVTTDTQTLTDGNKIVHTITAQFYRDADGRTRVERTFTGLGPWGGGTPKTMIEIHDPVAGVSYTLDSTNQTATKMTTPQPTADQIAAWQAKHTAEQAADQAVTESLGTQTIDGLPCTGTRVTTTIPAGKIGNQQAITVVKESWLSTDLQIVLQSKRTDPRMGELDVQFQTITRGAPDASLFQVPAGYTVWTRQHDKFSDEMHHGVPPVQ